MPDTFDVVIAGGGNAALCAALVAADSGASVCVIEAAPVSMRGGNTRHTRNMRVVHEAAHGTLTGPYPFDEYWDDLMRVTAGETNQSLARLTLEDSARLWDFLWQYGVRFQPSLGGTLSLGRTNAFFLGGGRSMLNALYRAAADRGVVFAYDAKVVGLELSGLDFSAARVSFDWQGPSAREELIKGRTFIAASGGFESNFEWLREAWGAAADNFLIRGTPHNRGEVLRLLLDAGAAAVGDPKQCHAIAIDGRAPRYDGGIVTRLDSVPFGVVVNKHGDRFYDEGEDFWPKRYAIWGRLIAAQPDQVAFSIIDSKSIDSFMPSVFPPEVDDTLEGLAVKLGLDPQALCGSIEAFNAACLVGDFDHTIHDDCATEGLEPRKSHWARAIDSPPFYGYSLRPGITFTYLGVAVDQQARILDSNGRPSRNMFAAGEIMAGNVLGKGYLAGIGMTIGSVFGRLAGLGVRDVLRG